MKELPRIARARLAGPGPTSPGGSAPAARPHPDANLLSAFAERSLTAAERSRVLEHLAVCAECRAEIQLALRATVDARDVAGAAAERREPAQTVSGWQSVLRWDALAAAMAALAAVVIFQFAIRSGIHSTSRLPASGSIARSAEQKAAPVLEARNEAITASKPAAKLSYRALQRTESQLRGTAKAAKSAPGNPAPRALGGVVAEQAALPIVASAPPPPAPSDAAKARDVLEQRNAPAAMAGAVAKNAVADSSNAPQPIRPAAPAAPQQRAAVTESKVARQASPAPTQGVMGGLAGAANFLVAPPGPAVRWAIGPVPPASGALPGDVERSLDGGRTWQVVAIDGNVGFRAVFAIGDQVWAGGSGGALYHSSDSGGHWTPVHLDSEGAESAGDIVAIRFANAERGIIETSDGAAWITTDGGQHWQRRP
ncbi:MAG TPA: YCF48-related protein [Terriglobia bacterium]|nr:YCF48-related protein [Terriglobia bacterium]